jgi:hypothetical protein
MGLYLLCLAFPGIMAILYGCLHCLSIFLPLRGYFHKLSGKFNIKILAFFGVTGKQLPLCRKLETGV